MMNKEDIIKAVDRNIIVYDDKVSNGTISLRLLNLLNKLHKSKIDGTIYVFKDVKYDICDMLNLANRLGILLDNIQTVDFDITAIYKEQEGVSYPIREKETLGVYKLNNDVCLCAF